MNRDLIWGFGFLALAVLFAVTHDNNGLPVLAHYAAACAAVIPGGALLNRWSKQ